MISNTPLSPGSLKRSVSIATAIMIGSVFLSRIMGLVREQVIAGLGGTSVEVDAYNVAFFIPEILNHLIAGGFLSVTFIPIFQKYLVSGKRDKGWDVFSNLINVGTLLLFVLIGICWLSMDSVMGLVHYARGAYASTYSPEETRQFLQLTRRITLIILPAQIFFYWGGFFMAVQYANQKFFWPAMAPLCYNLSIILCGVALSKSMGMEGFAWGVLIGAFVGNVAIQLPSVIRLGMRYLPRIRLNDPDLIHYVALTLPFIFGVGISFSNEIFFRFFGMTLEVGAVSRLNYALKVMMLLVSIFGQATAAASYPFLSRLAAEGNLKKLNELLSNVIRRACTALIPISAISMVLSRPIIGALFERGRFTGIDTASTGLILMAYLPGAAAYAASTVAIRGFYALQNTIFPTIITTVVTLLFFPLYWLGARYAGAPGIAAATSLWFICQFLVIYLAWSKQQKIDHAFFEMIIFLVKLAGIGLCGAVVCQIIIYGIDFLKLPVSGLVYYITLLVAAGVPALVASAILLHVSKLQSLSGLRGLLKKGN